MLGEMDAPLRRSLMLTLALALTACGGPAVVDDRPPETASSGPPFTAEKIRDATAEGRTYRYRMGGSEGGAEQVIRFVDVDPDGATFETTVMGDDGSAVGEPRSKRVTWEDLERHAHFPPGTTERETPCQTPAGRFECVVYTVPDAEGTTLFYFARSLPGAPVRVTAKRDGREVMVMELVEHRPGG